MKVHTLLSSELVLPDLASRTRDAVLEEMVRSLKSKEKINKDRELLEKLIQRENLGSTAIGEGVAVPHCKLKEIQSPLLALARSKKGVEFASIDGKPAQVFFLVVSSPDNPSQSLQILAAIAHLVRGSPSLVKKILAARSPGKIIEVIREEEEKGNA